MKVYYKQCIIDLDKRRGHSFYKIGDYPLCSNDSSRYFIDTLVHKQEQELFLLLEPNGISKVVVTNLVRVNNVLYGTLITDIPDYNVDIEENDTESLFDNEICRKLFLDKDLKEVHINSLTRSVDRQNALDDIVYVTELGSRKINLSKNNIISELTSDIKPILSSIIFDVLLVHDYKNVDEHYLLLGKTDSKNVFHPYKNGLVKIEDDSIYNKTKIQNVINAFRVLS